MAVEIVGRVPLVTWYEFEDGVFSIHKATKDGSETLFRSRSDTWPSITAAQQGIEYTLCVNATEDEAEKYIATEGLRLVGVHVL